MSSILIEIDLCPAEKGVVSEVIAQEVRHCPSSGHHVISTLDTLHFTPPPGIPRVFKADSFCQQQVTTDQDQGATSQES